MKHMLVKDWMTREVVSIPPDTTLPEAHRLMVQKRIRRLPVLRDGRLVGIITRGDVRGAQPSAATSLSIWELNYLISNLKTEQIMTHNPLTISQDATISEVARLMMENKISGVPVIDAEGKVAGIITESDIFRLIVDKWDELFESED
jgi:acetoin utilization protein AcuB